MIESLESRTLFSVGAVVGDVDNLNLEAASIKANFVSLKVGLFQAGFPKVSADLSASFKAGTLSAKLYSEAIGLSLGVSASVRTKFDDFASTGKAFLQTVGPDTTLIAADVQRAAAKPKNLALRKLLKSSIKQLEIDTGVVQILVVGRKQVGFNSSMTHIRDTGLTALDQIVALTGDKKTQQDISDTEDTLTNGLSGLRGSIAQYFSAISYLERDAAAFA